VETSGVAYHVAGRLVELAPYRETGDRILMETPEQRGNHADALLVYDRLRVLLGEELACLRHSRRRRARP
jgi:DNA-binding SARP family transcriptional activator